VAGRPARHARRDNANERFRQGLLAQASALLREFAKQLVEEPDAGESVAFELRRLAQSAETLQLSSVARAANEAALNLEENVGGVRSLRRVANAIRHTGGRLRFGPLVIVGVKEEQAALLREERLLCSEPVRLYPTLAAFASGLHTEQPAAIVLAATEVSAVGQLASRERFPVLVHGSAGAVEDRLAAMAAGAHGFLVSPFALAEATHLARWQAQPQPTTIEVLILADPDPAIDALGRALMDLGCTVVRAANPTGLATALEVGSPRAVVLGASVGGRSATALASVIRGHPRFNQVPILVWGRPRDAPALRAAGVDDVMRASAGPGLAAQRVRDRAVRVLRLPWRRDPVSGMANRLGSLDALDAELARASRSQAVLSVVLIELVGLRHAVQEIGSVAHHRARRRLMGLVDVYLRQSDVFGELDLGELIIAMPDCSRATALARVQRLQEAFREQTADDPHLRDVRFAVGAAESSAGLQDVAIRAERELRASGGRSS